ncbi:MAG TPA: ABC transporter permease [Methanomassiliicoccales archaeon]|jgi:ABC-2 type transport system permease protein|nr:ABC transporter permease [Methanomassiliicoccales archaeon]
MAFVDGTVNLVQKTLVIAEIEARKLRHDPTELLTRAIQPILWLLVFGEVINQVHLIPIPGMSYIDFLTPGVLAQSILFISIFYGLATIWERDLGIVQKLLTTPVPRIGLVSGKALSAGIRALSQALIIYILALLIGVNVDLNPLAITAVLVVVLLGAAIFATLSLIIACLVRTQEKFMGIGQMITMPLFFASNAIYPISLMPSWLQVIAYGNPLTYMVDALRSLMVYGAPSEFGVWVDMLVLIGTAAALILIAARLYPRVAQ